MSKNNSETNGDYDKMKWNDKTAPNRKHEDAKNTMKITNKIN